MRFLGLAGRQPANGLSLSSLPADGMEIIENQKPGPAVYPACGNRAPGEVDGTRTHILAATPGRLTICCVYHSATTP